MRSDVIVFAKNRVSSSEKHTPDPPGPPLIPTRGPTRIPELNPPPALPLPRGDESGDEPIMPARPAIGLFPVGVDEPDIERAPFEWSWLSEELRDEYTPNVARIKMQIESHS